MLLRCLVGPPACGGALCILLAVAVAEPARDTARRAAACDGGSDGSVLQLLQTSVAAVAAAGGAGPGVAAARAARAVEAGGSRRLALVETAAAQQARLGAGVAVGDASASARLSSWRGQGFGGSWCLVLPVLGLGLAAVAICVTVAFDTGAPPKSSGGELDWRLPLRPLVAAGGRAAEGLLQVQGDPVGFGKRRDAPYFGYSHPAPCMALVGAPETPGALTSGLGFLPPPSRPPHTSGPGQVQLTIPAFPEGEAIGLNLSEEDLVIDSFADPVASAYGFQIGDRILSVNNAPVSHQDDLVLFLSAARKRNAGFGEPIVITVHRSGGQGGVHDWGLWIGAWELDGHPKPPGPRLFTIRAATDGLVIEQGSGHKALRGELHPNHANNTYQATLYTSSGLEHGIVRLGLGADGALTVATQQPDADTFGADFRAKRADKRPKRQKAACTGAC